MSIKIAILKETAVGERRVAMVPQVLARLQKEGMIFCLEEGAGKAATYLDATYQHVSIEADLESLLKEADIVLAVQPPSISVIQYMKPGATLISFIHAQNHPELIQALCERKITTFAMEMVPRISRAQALDALSSQAALAGYYAPLLGASKMQRILPMMTTAVGSLRAAQVLVMGLGVAGLQALATAHRLGAICEGYDVRPETKEQAESVGAKFVDTGIDARGEGGYARELTPEENQKVQEVLSQHIARADMIITTAAVPGKKAPRLITAEQIAHMKEGAVIVDMGAEGGGNCEGTKPGETVKCGPALLIGAINLPSALAQQASELYAKNIAKLLDLIVKDQKLAPDFTDEVVEKTAITRNGEITNETVKKWFETIKIGE